VPSDSGSAPSPIAPEILELQARVAHLEQTQQEMRQRHLADLKALRQSQHLLNAILDNSRTLIFAKDTSGRFIMVNRCFEEFHNRPRAEILGKTAHDFLPQAFVEKMHEEDRAVLAQGDPMVYENDLQDATGTVHSCLTIKFPLKDASGAISGLGGIVTDVTDRKRAIAEREALQSQIIETQRAALRELSTPLIPLADRVLVVPLIGTLDSERSAQVLETLLSGVTAERAHTVIVDITGVRTVDATVARALVQAARATRLLGAELILTGLRAEIAQTLVGLGADLSEVVTRSSLQAGIAYAMKRTEGLTSPTKTSSGRPL
jgi:anti-anti-sigma factor